MSRIGKRPISIPAKTSAEYSDHVFKVKGQKGELTHTVHPNIDIRIENKVIYVGIVENSRENIALQGMTQSKLASMVEGVSKGFERILEINGIGYRAEVKGNYVHLNLGYSHPVDYELPEGVTASAEKNNTVLKLYGFDKELLGHVSAAIRQMREPEPYKGKGIKYAEEYVQRKAGKTGTK